MRRGQRSDQRASRRGFASHRSCGWFFCPDASKAQNNPAAVFLPLRRTHGAARSRQEKCALIYFTTRSEWPFCNSGRVFAVRNRVGTCASVTPSLYGPARPGQREQTRVDGRTGLQLTNKASPLRRHGGSFIAWLLLLGALWAGAGAARGADLPSKTGPPVFEPPPAAEFSWTGFYLGVHGGGGVDHFGFPFAILVPGGDSFHGTNDWTHRRYRGRIQLRASVLPYGNRG